MASKDKAAPKPDPSERFIWKPSDVRIVKKADQKDKK